MADVYRMLGRREAFSLVAGRCSAADVECIRRIRDEKLYLSTGKDWETFCRDELHMCKSNANHLIALLRKFGPQYFQIAQMTGISVAQYRAIAPAVSADGIACDGEVIPLTMENAARVSAAVDALRTKLEDKTEPEFRKQLAELDAAGKRLLNQYRELRRSRRASDSYLSSSLMILETNVHHLVREVA